MTWCAQIGLSRHVNMRKMGPAVPSQDQSLQHAVFFSGDRRGGAHVEYRLGMPHNMAQAHI
jgi:hypothetical protein